MRRFLRYFIPSAFFALVLVYAMCAFIKWQANPSLWPEDFRVAVAFFGVVSVGACGIILAIILAPSRLTNQ